MKLGIMQPYFLPYIGYFQLIASVDKFIIYDNIKYTKKGWINRNRILMNDKAALVSLPLKKGSDSLEIVDRELAIDYDRNKLLNKLKGAYGRAAQFELTYPFLERIVQREERNLFCYIKYSISQLCEHLGINTEIINSSEIEVNQNLRGQDRVMAMCKAVGAYTYINPVGGLGLYDPDEFRNQGIKLKFCQTHHFEYEQLGSVFVPRLSIVDVLMFNPIDAVRAHVESGFDYLEL